MTGWRRVTGRLALIGLVFEVLIGVFHAGLLSGVAQAADGKAVTYIEICTPTGIKLIAWDGGAPAEEPAEEPDGPADPQSRKTACLVCTALGALPLACLDAEVDIDWQPGVALVRPQDREIALPGRPCLPKLSRAPPQQI